jgi:hypothetical protein
MKSVVFWDVTPCNPLQISRRLGGTYVSSACPLTFNRLHGVISQKIVLSWDRGSMNDNNGFWIRRLDFLPPSESESESESESYVTTNGQSASLSFNKAPIWVSGLLMWGALSEERTVLSFIIAAGPRQLSHFRVRVPGDSWLYFTVSDSRIPFPSSPTTRMATVEVFDPASTREILEQSESYFTTDGQSASLSWHKAPYGACDQIFITNYVPLYTRITRDEPNRGQHLEEFVCIRCLSVVAKRVNILATL